MSKGKKQPSVFKKTLTKIKKNRKKIILKTLGLSLVVLFWSAIILFIMTAYYSRDLPDLNEFANKNIRPQITIYSYDKVELAKYGDSHGDFLTYSQIPQPLINAIVAAEDRRFFNHIGIDLFGILRAYFVNLRAGKLIQGGSTITQQLAKNVYLSPEKTFKRKFQEMLLALQLEQKFTKEQIFTMYLNRVYLGKGNYGIDAAAKYYFGKQAGDLNLYESAMIAGMLKAPSRYSPGNNLVLSNKRARQVLNQMEEEGFISHEENMNAKPPHIIERAGFRGALKNPYFTDYILSEIDELIENSNQDLNIYTTLDLNAQNTLEASLINLSQTYPDLQPTTQAAAIAMEPNGAIKAMVGGTSYKTSQFNRAVLAKRQPGSAFKFFVYLTALENGVKLSDVYTDKEIAVDPGYGLPLWMPRNFNRKFLGDMTVERAFAESTNTIAVQISEQIGRRNTIEMARRLGVKSSINNVPSLALGSEVVTVLEMTQAFAHIANNGLKTKAFSILKITDRNNDIIYEYPGLNSEIVINEDVVYSMKKLLHSVVENGTGRSAHIFFQNIYGKTGTTQDYRDAWFIGFNDSLVTAVWVGNDDNTPMNKITGSKAPALIWKDFMSSVGRIEPTEIPNSSTPWRSENIFDIIFNSSNSYEESKEELNDELSNEDLQ
jgi:penicillin-binding protein 1A